MWNVPTVNPGRKRWQTPCWTIKIRELGWHNDRIPILSYFNQFECHMSRKGHSYSKNDLSSQVTEVLFEKVWGSLIWKCPSLGKISPKWCLNCKSFFSGLILGEFTCPRTARYVLNHLATPCNAITYLDFVQMSLSRKRYSVIRTGPRRSRVTGHSNWSK